MNTIVDSEVVKYSFLSGGGEMGALMRAKDWRATSMGDIAGWPQSLRTTLGILLHARFPMFLWWGPDLICFYNDAYRPSLGRAGKHPSILGQKAEAAWPEIWHVIKPLIDKVQTGGQSVWMENQLIPIERNGHLEDVYWTFSYSPVRDESGRINGVLVICNETTDQVHTLRKAEESEYRFRNMVNQAPVPTAIFRGSEYVIELANEEALRLWGKDKSIIGRKLREAIPELEGQPYFGLLDEVYSTGKTYEGAEDMTYLERDGRLQEVYVNFIYKALHDAGGVITGILTMGYDTTAQVQARKKAEEAERLYSDLIQTLPVAVYTVDKEGRIAVFNEAAVTLWGRVPRKDQDRWCGAYGLYTLDGIRITPEKYHIRKAVEEDRSVNAEAYVCRPDGSMRHVISHQKPIHDIAGKVTGAMNVLIDITDHKMAEEALQVSEEKFRSLTQIMPQLIWTTDPQGVLTYFSPSVLSYTGLAAGPIGDGGWLQWIHPEEREENEKNWMYCIRTGEPFLQEHRHRRYDGIYRWHLSRAIPQRDAEGKILMWVGTSTDIDEIKLHAQQKDDFIKIASHELKTPITTIKGYVQLLLRELDPGKEPFLQQSLTTIDKQVSRLTKLVGDLLDVTKIEMGSFQMNKKIFRMGDIVRDTIRDIQATTVTHTLLLDQEADPSVYIDRDRIQQVLVNLFTNAIKYSPHASQVQISMGTKNGDLLLSVRDHGIGIAAEDREKIFSRFYRVSGKDEKTFPGFGIGLFIVDEIITQHGGKVWVESEKGRGSVFFITLPVQEA